MSAVVLAPLTPSDLGAVETLVTDGDVLRFTRVPDPPPAGFVQFWYGTYEEGRREGTREVFAIVDSPSGEFLGIAVAPQIDRATRTAELGYVVAPAARGRGVASEALRRLTEWAFSDLGMERVELLISVENESSKRVAARCGYVHEGVLRSRHFKGNLREDTEIWSRLPSDP
jgi:RimJ/RimL family protein N-acetyltransferase